MQVRKYPLPPDLQYVLDGACDEHELLGHHHFALTRYAEIERLDAACNRERPTRGRGALAGRRAMCLEIAAYADGIIAAMPEVERSHCSALAYAHMRKAIDDYAEFLADWNYTDVIKGGCAVAMHYRRVRRDQTGTKGALRVLYAPSAIRRYVKREIAGFQHQRVLFEHVLRLPLPASLRPGEAYTHMVEQHILAQREAQYAAMARVKAMRGGKAEKPCTIIKKERARRKVTVRAAVMAAALLGTAAVSAFARGEPVHIAGQDIDFRVRPTGRLSALGHGAVRVEVMSKNGEKLSNLCVYHDETPALDQLTAFALRIQGGQEHEIIKTGNLFAVEAAALNHPALKERAASHATADIWHRGGDDFRSHMADYRRDTMPIYRDAVAVHMLGRRAKAVMGLAND